MRLVKKTAVLMTAICVAANTINYVAPQQAMAAQNSVAELKIGNIPEANTIKVGECYNFNPKIVRTENGKGKTTDIVYFEVNSKTNKAGVQGSRWGYTYPVYEGSFEIRAVAFANTSDMNKWLAARSANNYVEDKAAGKKYVTAYSDWEKITVVSDTEGLAVVRWQKQLDWALKNKNVTDIVIKTNAAKTFKIKKKDYTTKTLTIDAEKAKLVNAAAFKQINIVNVKRASYYEKASDNVINVLASGITVNVTESAAVKEIIAASDTKAASLNISCNGGKVDKVSIVNPTELCIKGETEGKIKIVIGEGAEASGITVRGNIETEIVTASGNGQAATVIPGIVITQAPGNVVTSKPTATPRPTATPKPTATATPRPTATATPRPTATATPRPTATATPRPTATATPRPTATATPRPTATAIPRPTATATPRPTATATPVLTSAPAQTGTVNAFEISEFSGSLTSGNYSGWYNWSGTDKAYLFERADGNLDVIVSSTSGDTLVLKQYIYDSGYNCISEKNISMPYPVFGGIYLSSDNEYFVATGQTNSDEDDSKVVFCITKYDSSWNELGRAEITGAQCESTVPFDAGACRMDMSGNNLIISTARERYKSSDGLNHQSNIVIMTDADTMDTLYVSASFPYNHVSHSFNQFVKYDGMNLIYVDHGDAYPRSVYMQTHTSFDATNVSDEYSAPNYGGNNRTELTCMEILGTIGDNFTGTKVNGFELGTSYNVITGVSVPHDTMSDTEWSSCSNDTIKNVYAILTDKAGTTAKTVWLTDYSSAGSVSAENLRMIKINDDRFALIYQIKNISSGSYGTGYMLINSRAEIIESNEFDYYYSAAIQPVYYDGKIVWLDNTLNSYGYVNTKNVLYSLDIAE